MSHRTNRQVRGFDVNAAQVLHGEEIGPDDWRAVDIERPSGLAVYSWEQFVSRVGDLVGEGYIHRLEAGAEAVCPDRSGNLFRDHHYLPSAIWLRSAIPPYAQG